jgi:thiol-disulfide isomerase/thioredoxin
LTSQASRRKTAREQRAAELRAAQARAERRRRLLLAGGAIGLVLAVVLALVIANAAGVGDSETTTQQADGPREESQVARAVTSVPADVLDQVGVGGAQAAPRRIDAPALTADGKHKVLYVGAEFCPFCAAERWPVVVALSRFGTWTGLSTSSSASDDVFPNTPTLTFSGAEYSSDYLAFAGYETATNEKVNGQYAPLDELSADDQKIVDTYNRPPYTAGTPGGIPFLDLGGEYVSSGASYSPELLAGKTHDQVADALDDPEDPIAQAVGGSANVLTAALCELTDGEPAEVCTAPGVTTAAKALAGAQE